MKTNSSLDRFLVAQQDVYPQALAEIRRGHKTSHWMWFIFPQINGLGLSETARFYAIDDREEAGNYLRHPVLGARLREISSELLKLRGKSADEIFGGIDSMKLRSSMTLFASIADSDPVFQQVIDTFFDGRKDAKTIALLEERSA